MAAQLTPELEAKVKAAAKRESGENVEDASVGRFLLTYPHCGGLRVKVEVFVKKDPNLPSSDGNRRRGRALAVCRKCLQVSPLGRG